MARRRQPPSPQANPTDAIDALEAATSKANKAIAELREATREAHEAVQAAKEARAEMVRRVAKEFDERAHEILVARAQTLMTKVDEDMRYNVAKVKEAIVDWNDGMDKTSARADKLVGVMARWLESFAKLSDELEKEIKASNRDNPYVQGIPDRVFGSARADTREVLGDGTERRD